jgi:hypothetical protein
MRVDWGAVGSIKARHRSLPALVGVALRRSLEPDASTPRVNQHMKRDKLPSCAAFQRLKFRAEGRCSSDLNLILRCRSSLLTIFVLSRVY